MNAACNSIECRSAKTYHVCQLLEDSSNVSDSRFYFMQSLISAGQIVVLGSRQHHLLLLLLLLLLLQEWLPANMAAGKLILVEYDRQPIAQCETYCSEDDGSAPSEPP